MKLNIVIKLIEWFKSFKAKKEAEQKFIIKKKYYQVSCEAFINYYYFDINNLTVQAEYCRERVIKFRNSRCQTSAQLHLDYYNFYINDCSENEYKRMYKNINEQLSYCEGNKEETKKYLELKSKLKKAQKNIILLSDEEIKLKLKKVKLWDKKKQFKKDFK